LNEYATIQQESCFWRRSLWNKSRAEVNKSLKFAGDYELWMRFFDYGRLYCLETVLGGFRARSGNQASVEHLNDYTNEVNVIFRKRLKRLSIEEQRNLGRLSRYKKLYRLIPFLRIFLYNIYIRNLHYPPAILFDRKKQKFILESDTVFSFLKRELGYDDFLHGKY
jgi:hypothetical protein